MFYDVSKPITNSLEIRSLANKTLNPQNGTSFTINIPVGATSVIFCYPATLRAVTSVTYTELGNANVTDTFTETNVSVEGANGYIAIPYRCYVYTPSVPFSSSATYVVTI